MRIAHPRRNYSGVEIHQARRLEFVDGVAETDDNKAFAAALAVKGYTSIHGSDAFTTVNGVDLDELSEREVAPKRKRGKTVDHSLEDDVTIDPADVERTYDD
ncbi:hypothetical protein [Gordonia terrae]